MEVSVTYHQELNPKLWDGFKMKPEVLNKLREIAAAFLKFLDVPNLKVDDMVIIGSSANYNWTETSDLDLHLVMDLDSVQKVCKDFTEELFDAKNDGWKEKHDISIYGLPVEVYIQDNTTDKVKDEGIERHITGVFSIQSNKWLRKPSFHPPEINDTDVKIKSNAFKRKINKIVDSDLGIGAAKTFHKKIKYLRKSGLHKYGEFSTENLVFKELRNSGAIEKLLDYIRKSTSEKLSLEGVEFENQELTLEHRRRVMKARTLEYVRMRNFLYAKYGLTSMPGSTVTELETADTTIHLAPPLVSAFRSKKISDEEMNRITALFNKMIDAKKSYEYGVQDEIVKQTRGIK